MTLERYFLGQCLWDTSIPINTKVKPEDFETSYARDIFIAMLQLINEGKVIDEATLSEHTKLPLSHFLKLKDLNIIRFTWKSTEKQIIKLAQIRKIRMGAKRIFESNLDDPQALISEMHDIIETINISDENYSIRTIDESMHQTMTTLRECHRSPNKLVGITSGIERLDHQLGGFQKRQLYVIGARPSQGKTALLLNFIKNCNCPCGIISAESAIEELNIRLLAMDSKHDAQGIVRGNYEESVASRLEHSAFTLSNKPPIVCYDEPMMSIDTAIRKARAMKKSYNIEILFVDYLQILGPSNSYTKRELREQVAYVSSSLKQLARSLDIPVVAAAQLRRNAEGLRPQLNDFSDSTQIERDADVCLFIYHRKVKNKDPESWLLISKNRNGSCRDVPVYFKPEHLLFTDRELSARNDNTTLSKNDKQR